MVELAAGPVRQVVELCVGLRGHVVHRAEHGAAVRRRHDETVHGRHFTPDPVNDSTDVGQHLAHGGGEAGGQPGQIPRGHDDREQATAAGSQDVPLRPDVEAVCEPVPETRRAPVVFGRDTVVSGYVAQQPARATQNVQMPPQPGPAFERGCLSIGQIGGESPTCISPIALKPCRS